MTKPLLENFLKLPLDLLERTKNPAHRAMVINFVRHELLEIGGLWREVVKPDMTVEHPVYRISFSNKFYLLDGMDAVCEHYTAGFDNLGVLAWPGDGGFMSVDDWGVSAERVLFWQVAGRQLLSEGDAGLDPDRIYIKKSMWAHFFPYRDGRLLGEHIYEGGPREVWTADPADIITSEQAREIVAPLLRKIPPK